MNFKRFLAVLLALVLIVSAIPTVASAAPAKEEPTEDIWDVISVYEDAQLALRHPGSYRRGEYQATAADFAALSKDVETIVTASASFREGTIERHGDFFFWEDVDGNAYGYSPRMRSQIRKDAANASADPEELAGVEVTDFSERGGSAGSVNVATFQPYYGIDSSFEATYATEGQRIAKAAGGTSTNYKTTNATIDAVANALETCGVVIFDSHGDTDYASGEDYVTRANTSYLCMQTNAGWTSADQQAVTGPYGTYYHCFNAGSSGSMKYYEVDGTGFANHMKKNGCNNLLWMAICLGMATDGLWKPLHAKGVEAIYGYSQSVSFSGDYKYEEYFFDYLIDGHTVGESFAYMKQKTGKDWDPAYSASSLAAARYNFIAFPNLVSSEDAYQGHRIKNPSSANDSSANNNNDPNYGACNIQTPVSTWTLLPQYEVTAVSNNNAWGTVAVSNKTITATPAEGYYVAGYEVLSGTATVTQNGNFFTVKPESDCTVQINFAAKTPATISFVTPDGVSCANVSTYVGDKFVLPTPEGTPTADAQEYFFAGWTRTQADNVTEAPTFYSAGTSLTATGDATYYALYSYRIDDGSSGSGFELLDVDPVNWAGEYILTYNKAVVLDASGLYTGASLGSKEAAVALADTGMVLSGNTLLQPNDKYVYVIEPSATKPGSYTIRMAGSNNYISYTGNTNSVTTTDDKDRASAQWNLSFQSGLVSLQNVNTVGTAQVRYLQYNTTSKQFRCYTNTMKNLTLFTAQSGTHFYTTVLADACKHEYEAVVTAPSCTEGGYTTYTCKLCGHSYVADETAALGHDWDEGEITVIPTEEQEGELTYTCKRCHATRTETLPKANHEHVYEDTTVAPTCTEEGYTLHTCTTCGASYKSDFVDALGHDFGEWSVSLAPTCTEKGEETRACSRCQEKETRELDAAGHLFVDGVCTVCGAKDPDYVAPPTFDDVPPKAYFAAAVDWAVANNVTNGTGDNMFKPDAACTRGQVVTFLWRAKGSPEPTKTESPFADVQNAKAFYYKAVLWAMENGITAGVDALHFAPDGICTRGQVVTFLWRTENKPEPKSLDTVFTDVDAKGFYYKAMCWAVENKVTNGQTATTFAPGNDCTRGQIVTFLYRAVAD